MRAITITRPVGKYTKGEKAEVGNKSALYLVEHGYATYQKGEKNLPKLKRVPNQRSRVDAMTTDDLHGGS
jgi:hypothetical protein